LTTYNLTTGTDTFAGTGADETVNGTSAALNATDSLDGGTGYDVLALYGPGTFDLSTLAQFTGFEEVDVTNITGGASNLTLRNGSGALTVNVDNSLGGGGTIHLADGTTTLNLGNTYSYTVDEGGGDATVNFTQINNSTFNLSNGASALNGGKAFDSVFNLASGSTSVIISEGVNDTFNFSSGNATVDFTVMPFYGSNNTFNLSTGTASIKYTSDYTSGDFILSTGQATIDLSASTGGYSQIVVGIGTLRSDDVFKGGGSSSFYIADSNGTFDFTAPTLAGQWSLSFGGTNDIVDINTATLSHLTSIFGNNGDVLRTADATLDLSHTSVSSGVSIVSTNVAGTTFTVADANTALDVIGGSGNDTLIGQGFAFTASQRATIFAQNSVETITDKSGTYTAPPGFTLTTGTDTFAGTGADETVNGTSAALNATDSLDGGTGYDVLALYGPGTFDLSTLAQFTGFEEVDVTNITGGASNLTLRNGSGALTVNVDNSLGGGGTIHLADGTTTLNLGNTYSYTVDEGGGDATVNFTQINNSTFNLSNGASALNGGKAFDSVFNLASGSTSVIISEGVNDTFNFSSGNATVDFTVMPFYGSNNTFNLSTGTASIKYTSDYTSGDFILSTGQATIDLSASTGGYSQIVVGIGTLRSDDVFKGGGSSSFYIADSNGTFDFTAPTLAGQWSLSFGGTNDIVDINTATLSHLTSIFGNNGDVLRTADATLDLSHTSVSSGVSIVSTNVAGTTFTVADANTALDVIGGSGNDTLIGQGFAFTASQRATIFAQNSVETITDATGAYGANGSYKGPPAPTVTLTHDTGISSTDVVTSSSALSGSGDPGAIVHFKVDGTQIAGTAIADSSGNWAFTPTGLADGAHIIAASETDSFGNTGVASVAFILDTTEPAATEKLANDTGLSSADSITNDATITGSGDANAVVHFVVDGNAVAETTTANASGSWTYSPAGLLGGYHTVVASETDAAGNTGTATLTFDVDTTAVAGLSFTNTTFAAGVTPYGAATSDLNHDGKPDIVVTNYNAGEVSVLLGNGDGSFQAPVAYATGGNGVVAVQIADLNGDGIPDLVSTEEANDTVSVLIGNGDGTFQNETTYTSGVRPHGVAIGDVNGDGQPDLVVADFGSNAVSVFLGNGNGTFASPTSYAVGTEPYGVKIGDLNGDGKPDVVVSNPTSSTFSVLLANGDGTFQPQSSYQTGATSWEGALADLNGDGKLDYVVPSMANGTVSVFLGNGDGSFQSATNYTVNNGPTAVVIGDLNGDGLPDLAVTSAVGTLSILLGNGNGTFQSALSYQVGSFPTWVVAADFNGDGKLDLGVANASDNTVSVLSSILLKPSAPADAAVVNGYVNAAHDTAAQALTGVAEAGSTVKVFDNGAVLGTATADASTGAWIYTEGSLADGSTHSYVVTATDAAGNVSPASDPLAFAVDTQAPAVTMSLAFDTSLSAKITSNDAIAGTGDANAVVHFAVDGTVIAATATADASGVWTYTPIGLTEGSHTIVASETDAAGNIGTSALAFTLVGPASAVTSSITATPATVTADGVSATTLTVTVEDAYGYLLPNAAVTLSGSGGSNSFGSISGTTNANGVFTTTLASTLAQTETITATEGSTQEQIAMTFVPGMASATTSRITASPGSVTANGVSTSTLTVTLQDAYGNLVPNAAVTLYGSGGSNSFGSISGTTNANGVFTTTLASTLAQTETITATEGSAHEATQISFVPVLTGVSASPNSGDVNTGQVVNLTLNFSNSVLVTGTPVLTLNDGGTATYKSGTGTNALIFTYTVANGQNTPALAITGNNLNGSTINISAGGITPDLSIADVSFPALEVGATVKSVAFTPAASDLGPGKIVTIAVTMTEAVKITGGTPSLSLNDGGTATYKSGSGTNVLTFSYTIGALGSSQNTAALAITGFNPNGATIYDSNVLADTASLSGVTGFITGPQIDTIAPTVLSVAASPSVGDLDAGNSITLTVNFSENVTVTGSPYLALNDGGKATYTSGSGTTALTFTYTVASGQNTPDLVVTSLALNGGTIKDGAADAAVLTGANNYNPAGILKIDTTAPAVTERLVSDTGVSNADKITSNDALTGGGDPNAVVNFTVDGVASSLTTSANATGVWTFTPAGLSNGQHTVVASETDAAGNIGTASLTFTLDTAAPTVTSISTSVANGDLGVGNTVTLTVGFSAAVYATAAQYLTLNDGGRAAYASGSGTNVLTFSYTVAAGQNTPDLTVTGLSTGLTDIAGNVAALNGVLTNPGNTLQIDTIAPTIKSVVTSGTGITAGMGDVGPGSTVTLSVNFSENAFVNTLGGTPNLLLNDGGTAVYMGGSGSSALTFSYTVGALGSGQNVADLALATTNALSLNGGTILDGAGNVAVLTAANNYKPAGTLKIDTTAPTVTKVLSSVTSGRVNTGGAIRITLDTSEAVSISGSPTLLLNDGGIASYDATHSTTTALAFNYTVAAGQVTTDLVVSGIQLPSTASIEDLAGNNANLSGAGADLGLHINTASSGTAGPSGGNFTINASTELELFGPSTANVTFATGSTGTLRLDDSSQFAGTVAGLALGNYLDLADQSYQGNNAPTYNSTGANTGTLIVTEGGITIDIGLLGNYMASSFIASSDGHGGTLLTDPPPTTQTFLAPSPTTTQTPLAPSHA
jgi:Bacterial Ig-like domain (group 1)/Bacterial Ig-like domain/FG-GAP-like repeat